MYERFLLKECIKPIWDGDVVYNESVLPLENEDETLSDIQLLYDASELIEVRSSALNRVYENGRDYTLVDGKLHICKNGKIPVMKHSDYFFTEKGERSAFEAADGGYIYFSECADMHSRQLAVTYRHLDKMQNIPSSKPQLLPETLKKLINGDKVRILIHGDSISTGANSSGVFNVPPFTPAWYTMLKDALTLFTDNNRIELVNTAVGGTVSKWGAESSAQSAECHPDLAVIGFGMNDGSLLVPTAEFKENISQIINSILAVNPKCEFILISTMLANKAVKGFAGIQADYLPILLSFEKVGIAVADVTSVHKELLNRKAFKDMTGNNVNHPNDFLARVYAQVLLKTLGF